MVDCEHYTDSIYYQLEQTAKYCRYLGMQMFQKLQLPVTLDEFAALDTILINEGICQRDLARLILKDRPNTGRILNSLEEKGYIERYADTKNNRLVRKMKITEEGKRISAEVTKILKAYINKIPKVYSEEDKSKLRESIIKFRESLEQEVEMKI